MKRNRRKRVFSIICYIINIIIVFYPWIIVGNTKYNIVQLKRKIETIGIHTMIKRNGLIVDNPNFVGAMVKVQVVLYFCFILLCLGYIVCVVIGKNRRLNLVTFYASIGLMIVNITGYSIASLCTNTIQGTLFPIITVIITLIELLSSALPEKKTAKK